MAVEAALVAREKERSRDSGGGGGGGRNLVVEKQHGFTALEEGLLRGNVFLCGRKTARRRRRRMGGGGEVFEGRMERRKRSAREWRRGGRGGHGGDRPSLGERRTGRRRMRQLPAERIELKEAPPGMRKYWCTIVRENYKTLLGRPNQISTNRRREVIARLGQVLGRGERGGGVHKKLSLPISNVSAGKPDLTKGPASDPLVTKSSIRRRSWTGPARIHHHLQGIHYNQAEKPSFQNYPPRKTLQSQLQEKKAALIAGRIVAELKRRDENRGQRAEGAGAGVDQVLWGSFREGRRIWPRADSEENYILQELNP